MRTAIAVLILNLVAFHSHADMNMTKEEFLKDVCERSPKHCALMKSLNLAEKGYGNAFGNSHIFRAVAEDGKTFRVEFGDIKNGHALGVYIQ